MRILWVSAKPTIPSGYGTQTALLLPHLKALGHEVAVACHAGLFGAVEMWQGIRLFPHSNYPAQYGQDIVEHHAAHFKPDLIVSWMDAFVLQPDKVRPLPWCAWVPVDSWPLMKRNIEPLKACKHIISPTEWGKRAIEAAGLEVSAVIPCAFDSVQFYPLPEPMAELRATLSRVIGVEIGDRFLVNMVSANAGKRKNFEAAFTAWHEFSKEHPDALLFCHTDPTGYFFQGENLTDMCVALGVNTDSILFPPQWEYVCGAIPDDFLNLLYNCSDLHLNTCHGEGFGLPVLEAQAAGCPVLTPQFGAAWEVNQIKSNGIEGQLFYGVPGAMQFEARVSSLIGQLCAISQSAMNMNTRSPELRRALAAMVARYDVGEVISLWETFFSRLEKEKE